MYSDLYISSVCADELSSMYQVCSFHYLLSSSVNKLDQVWLLLSGFPFFLPAKQSTIVEHCVVDWTSMIGLQDEVKNVHRRLSSLTQATF